jgi:3-oxoacyl-[acyl-carrier-protein] synthase-3
MHQANTRILDTVAKRLQLSSEKVLTNLSIRGNTSAASIPLCLGDLVTTNGNDDDDTKLLFKEGDVVVLAGFGAGLSWGATVIRW